MRHIIELILGLLGNVLAGEFAAWSPKLANKLISYTVTKVPDEMKERLAEEWCALLNDTPGGISKLMRAISTFLGCGRIRHEYHHPEIPYRPYSLIALRAVDVITVLPTTLLMAPLFLFLYCLIKVTSPGPAIIQVDEIDSLGYLTTTCCFRTIHVKNSQNYKTTFIGKWLKRIYLDEVPEVYSILRGDMTIIGSSPMQVYYPTGAIAWGSDRPLPPSITKTGLIGLRPDELTRFLQNPLANYVGILTRAFVFSLTGKTSPLI